MYMSIMKDILSETVVVCIFFFKQKTAYEMRISDWSSDVCSSDLFGDFRRDLSNVRQVIDRVFLPSGGGSDSKVGADAVEEHLHRNRDQQHAHQPLHRGQGAGAQQLVQDGGRHQDHRGRAPGDHQRQAPGAKAIGLLARSEEHTSELQSLMRISYAVFRWKKK